MDAEHPTALPKIRTFARDQARVQHREEQAVVVPEQTPVKDVAPAVTVVEKQAPAVSVAHITVPAKVVPPPAQKASRIPAFHELKKSAPTPMVKPVAQSAPAKHSAPAPKKVSVTARKIDPVVATSGGTIITDNKKGEFKVLPSVFTSLKDWLKGLFQRPSSAPKYTVIASDRRKGVIQKATSNNATIFTADSDTLKEEIRRRQQAPSVPHKDITWTPHTEVGVPLLVETNRVPAPRMPVTITFKKQVGTLPPPTITEPRPLAVPVPPPRAFVPPPEVTNFGREEVEPQPAKAVVVPAPTFTTPLPPLPIPTVQPEAVPQPEPTPVPPPTPVAKVSSIPHTPNPKTSSLKNGLRTLTRFNTNLITVVFAGSIVSLVLFILIVRTFLGLIAPTNSTTDVQATVATLSGSGSTRDLAISSLTTEALYAALAAEAVPGTGVKELRLTDVEGTPLSPQTVLTLLNFNTNQNLNQSVTAVHLAFAQSRRTIILEVTDATTVFGALLAWEPTMAADLAGMLETGDVPVAAYTDKTIGQTDVRILSDDGTPVLVYGFIDKNTVAITQDLAAFTSLLSTTP